MPLEKNEKSLNEIYKFIEVQNEDTELGDSKPKHNFTQEIIAGVISVLGMLNTGIIFAWISPILSQLLSGTFKIQITMEQSVWIIGLTHIGAIPGCIVSSIVSNKYGRKKAIFMATIPFIISGVIMIFAETLLHYYIARFIAGFGNGVSFAVIPIYISEISSPQIRGILTVLMFMGQSTGMFCSLALGAYLPIVTYCSVLAIFPIMQFIFTFYLPESPYFHVIKKDYSKAEKTLKFLRKKSNVHNELKRLIEGYKEQTADKVGSVWDLFTDRTNLKSLTIVTVLLIGQLCTGLRSFFDYAQVMVEDGHSSISPETCGVIIGVMNFVVVLSSSLIIDRFGRRQLSIFSGTIMLLPLGILGVYFYLQDYTNFEYMEKLRFIPLSGIVFFKFAFGFGFHSMAYILTGELFPTSVKAYATSAVSIIGSALSVVSNKAYQVILVEFGYPGVFAMFITSLLLVLIFVYFKVPETKGLTLEEIQVRLRKSNNQ